MTRSRDPSDQLPTAPAWIATVPDDEADGELSDLYQRFSHPVAHILRASSTNPTVLQAHYDLYRSIMFGPSPLTRAQREMIATVVSLLNQCHYWLHHHGEALRQVQQGDSTLLRALVEDFRSAPVSPADRAMLGYVERLTREPWTIDESDIQSLRAVGWDDRAIHDIVQVVAYFNYVNRLANGLGVSLEATWSPD